MTFDLDGCENCAALTSPLAGEPSFVIKHVNTSSPQPLPSDRRLVEPVCRRISIPTTSAGRGLEKRPVDVSRFNFPATRSKWKSAQSVPQTEEEHDKRNRAPT